MQKKHRIFIAINLPQDIINQLASYQKKWPELPVRWTNKENLHITLSFLGYLTDIEMGEICLVTKEVANNHNSLEVNLNKISYGSLDKKPPRMVWARGEKSKELSILKNNLEYNFSEKINFLPEKRSFSPHITLARIKTFEWRAIEPEERPEINENIDLNFTVESIEVMESKLRRNGPMYAVVESNSLKS